MPIRSHAGARRAAGATDAGALCAGAALAGAVPAAAQGQPLSLSLAAAPVPRHSPAIELVARLAGGAGAAHARLGGATVTFSVTVAQFSGSPLLVVGTATTDSRGEATVTYYPTWTGTQDLSASAASAAGSPLAAATASVVVTSAAHPFAGSVEATRPDGTIGQWVVGALLAILVLLWVVLVTVVVRVRRGVAASAS
ncbi:MAG: hypothetical protein ACYCXY_09860 [Acidimicrobiales bacterium]